MDSLECAVKSRLVVSKMTRHFCMCRSRIKLTSAVTGSLKTDLIIAACSISWAGSTLTPLMQLYQRNVSPSSAAHCWRFLPIMGEVHRAAPYPKLTADVRPASSAACSQETSPLTAYQQRDLEAGHRDLTSSAEHACIWNSQMPQQVFIANIKVRC